MVDFSIRGVARRYKGVTGDFSLINSVLGLSSITGSLSLRSSIESIAHEGHSFSMSECIYGWTAAFEQTWTQIRIRIRLNPDAGITDETMNTLRTTWRDGIENTWNNKARCGRADELSCRLTFEVEWTDSDQHHTVRVRTGPAHTNMTTWDTSDTGAVAAHECGHMFGNPDEYTDDACPNRDPVNTGTVMDNNSNNVPARLMQRFADNIGSNVVAP